MIPTTPIETSGLGYFLVQRLKQNTLDSGFLIRNFSMTGFYILQCYHTQARNKRFSWLRSRDNAVHLSCVHTGITLMQSKQTLHWECDNSQIK